MIIEKGKTMFITLLIATFVISFVVSSIVVLFFGRPINKILDRIISDQISRAWSKYLKFAIYVTGISSGVRIWDLEKYITKPQYQGGEIVLLTTERWVLEVYRTVIGTLQGVAWMLLVFFVFALVAYVIVRVFEMITKAREASK
jgi:ABC-type transport system involved in multi-copper enzyme maturation permease subunit